MTNDSTCVVFRLDPDPTLLGVVRGAVQFQALQLGFASETSAAFGQACENVCRETISQLAESGEKLGVTLNMFHDRIEICIHHNGQMAPAVGLEKFAFCETSEDGVGGFNGLELLSQVDRVLYSTEDGTAKTTLVKFLHQKH